MNAAPQPARRAPYREFIIGVIVNILVISVILKWRDQLEPWLFGSPAPVTASCRIERTGQVAQITVRQHQGELIATCTIFEGRKG